MSNDRVIAGAILDRAKKLVTKERGVEHGSIEESFNMIAEMWSVYINNAVQRATGIAPNPRIHLSGVDVLRMMGQLKQARALWGSGDNADHYIDEAGYASIAAAYVGASIVPSVPPAKAEKIPSFLGSEAPQTIEEAVKAIHAEGEAKNAG